MNTINIFFINRNKSIIKYSENTINIIISTLMNNYNCNKYLKKIKKYINDDDKNDIINIYFDTKLNDTIIYKFISKIHNIFFNYKLSNKYSLFMIDSNTITTTIINNKFNKYVDELNKYKMINIDSSKNPNTYLEYVKSRVPTNYNCIVFNLKTTTDFPLTKAVGQGSQYNTYFVHIKPKIENVEYKTLYLIGKSITYDSGGLNLKHSNMHEMKTDMCGSAMILSVLNLLNNEHKCNIHLLIPIAENMISNTAVRPGEVITALGGKTVEILDTDAEGRLCIADALNYINYKLIKKENINKSIIMDVATLTGNTKLITSNISAIILGNNNSNSYINKIITIGEVIDEYVDTLKLREEYIDELKSTNADIANISFECKAGCVLGGVFLNYFVNPDIPFMHLDIASTTYIKSKPLSYGINLLIEFIKQL